MPHLNVLSNTKGERKSKPRSQWLVTFQWFRNFIPYWSCQLFFFPKDWFLIHLAWGHLYQIPKIPRGIKQYLTSTGTWCDIWPRGKVGNWNLHLLSWFLSLFVRQNTQARAVMEWKGLFWLIIQGHILVTGAWSSGSQKAEWWAVPCSPFSRGSSLWNGAAHS